MAVVQREQNGHVPVGTSRTESPSLFASPTSYRLGGPSIIPFVGTARHLAEAMNKTSGRPAAQWQRQLSLSSRHCGVVLAFVRLIIEPIVFCVSSDKQMTKSPPPAGAIVLPADIGTSRCWIIARFLSTSFTTSHGSLCTQRTRNLLPSRDRGRYWLTVALFFTAF
jgi:hypothetical protein